MKYFCAKCKKKHDIKDIVPDLWDMCSESIKEAINESLDELQKTFTDENQKNLLQIDRGTLLSFISEPTASKKYFLFSRNEVSEKLIDRVEDGNVLAGAFTLDMDWLLGVYTQSLIEKGYKNGDKLKAEEFISSTIGQSIIFSKKMRFYYNKNAQGEFVFLKVTEDNGDPFYDSESKVQRGFNRSCLHCGGRVSPALGKAEEVVIALSGAPRAGKTACLTAIGSALKNNTYADRGISMQRIDNDEKWKELEAQIELFDSGVKVTKTPMDQADVPSFSILTQFGRRKTVITFVDMPGEFWADTNGLAPSFFTQYADLYKSIDCVWYLTSKLAVYGADLGKDGSRTDTQKRLVDASSDDSEIIRKANAQAVGANLSSLKDHLENSGGLMPPFAFIITKPDIETDNADKARTALYEMFPTEKEKVITENISDMSRIVQKDRTTGWFSFMEKDFFGCSQQVRGFLAEANRSLLREFERSCSKRTYISMAAYGHPAGELGDEKNHSPKPYHELFPLLWTLAITGNIPIVHDCEWITKNIIKHVTTTRGAQTHRFDYRLPPSAANKKRPTPIERDKAIVFCDISANLLCKGDGDILRYTTTTYEHGR